MAEFFLPSDHIKVSHMTRFYTTFVGEVIN